MTGVKDQGSCGSCWSFATTGGLEGAHAVSSGELISLSEQFILDCSTDIGCNGGLEYSAWTWMKRNGESAFTESQYPYQSGGGRDYSCRSSQMGSPTNVRVSAITHVAEDPNQLKAALDRQPVAVGVAAGNNYFSGYSGGIMDDARCGSRLDHSVLAVGYGSNYFIVKNSWGSNWGENGYIRLGVASGAGICGVNSDASFPTTN